jgi:hypothetical protein
VQTATLPSHRPPWCTALHTHACRVLNTHNTRPPCAHRTRHGTVNTPAHAHARLCCSCCPQPLPPSSSAAPPPPPRQLHRDSCRAVRMRRAGGPAGAHAHQGHARRPAARHRHVQARRAVQGPGGGDQQARPHVRVGRGGRPLQDSSMACGLPGPCACGPQAGVVFFGGGGQIGWDPSPSLSGR